MDLDFDGPAAIVEDKYNRSIDLANAATSAVDGFQKALNESVYQPPTVSVRWESLAAPDLPPIPDVPTLPVAHLVIPANMPGALDASLGSVQIDDFDVTPPVLNFPPTPEIHIGAVPTLPQLRDVEVPDAPTVELPIPPAFLPLQTHSFGGINLHENRLAKLDEIPEFSMLQPAPFAFSPGAKYVSLLMDNLKATLNARIQGGTGLNPAVEAAIWGRAQDRENTLALAREQEIQRSAEALGFPLPTGVMVGQLSDARRELHDKLSGLSRDIAIEQAKLEQTNLQQASTLALQLESTLLDDAYKLEVLALDVAKAIADNAIDIHNSGIEHFKALLAGYDAFAKAYDTLIRAEMNKVEVFKALLQAEETKANINRIMVERYKAEIEGAMAVVTVFRERVGAAKTLVELEGLRMQAGAEHIKAFVATTNAETSKVELHRAVVSAEGVKAGVFETMVRAQSARSGAQADRARVEIAKLGAKVQAKALEWDGWKARLSASSAEVEAVARTSSMTLDAYRIGAYAAESQAGAVSRIWESNIKQYEASQTITLQAAKINSDAVMHTADARMEAAKVGLTTSSQRLASAWSMVGASATIQGNLTATQTL